MFEGLQGISPDITAAAIVFAIGVAGGVFNRLSSILWHRKHNETLVRLSDALARLVEIETREMRLKEREKRVAAAQRHIENHFPELKITDSHATHD